MTQLRTGKIRFNDFLYSRGVPEVISRRCICGIGHMTVKHIILACLNWVPQRNAHIGKTERDLRTILGESATAAVAIRMILATGILEQFRAVDAHAVREQERGRPT